MAVAGYGTGGASVTGPSTVYRSLPYRGYRELAGWFEELVDAMGLSMDVLYQRFIKPAARANLLDPTYTPTEIATNDLANATTAPLAAVSRDSMLDVLAYIALGQYPLDSNLTIAQKQALVQIGWTALKRKGTRLQLLNLASKMTDGVALGWTTPPFNFSIIVPDGEPSPGYGSWVQPLAANSETSRPWILQAIRNTLSKGMFPDWSNLGVGYSQFRWGYSSWGETYFPVGARINILAHEHFDTWAAGAPTGWTKSGLATLTQSTSDSSINWEFTGSAAVIDLTAQPSGQFVALAQLAANINNQFTHRLQLDYKYTNAQSVNVLTVQVTDANADGNTYYWNPTTATWGTAAYSIALPPSTTRGRYACDIVPQAASSIASNAGTSSISVKVFATSDGTATTQTTYTLYRVGLYEKFNLAIEQAATGERSSWFPLVDSAGWTTCSRTAGAVQVEVANATRTAYKLVNSSTGVAFPYHPALTGRGFLSQTAWTNLLKGSNDFGADWTLTNATRTANATISPLIGETSPSAPNLTATATGASISQATGVTPTSKTYCGGVWVKKNSADGNFTDVMLSLVSTTTKSVTYTLAQSQGWQLLPFNLTFGGGDVAAMTFKISWGAASTTGRIAVATSYLYDVTGFTKCLYLPPSQTPIGSTATLGANTCVVQTSTTNTNVLHPLTQRALQSVVRGACGVTIVPSLGANSNPTFANIFDLSQGTTQNRVTLRVSSNVLQLARWDNAGNSWTASLTLTDSPSPSSGQVTWKRDTALQIRCIWDENSTMLSAGNGNASGTKPGSWAPSDASVSKFHIGSNASSANQFDGLITLMEHVQLGAPVT